MTGRSFFISLVIYGGLNTDIYYKSLIAWLVESEDWYRFYKSVLVINIVSKFGSYAFYIVVFFTLAYYLSYC